MQTHTHTHTTPTLAAQTLCRYSHRCRYTDTTRGQPGDPRKVSKCRSKGKLNIAHLIWQPFYFHVSSIPQGSFSGKRGGGSIHVNTTLKCRAWVVTYNAGKANKILMKRLIRQVVWLLRGALNETMCTSKLYVLIL